MKAAPHPEQALRLETLRKYEILDTPREADFDAIVELASQICNVPISVVNLIDEERQWFKAEVGIGARETPLATSICSHVVLSDDFVEINDTHQDPRTADNELCLPADGLRFYAGALLKAPNGMPIGTLCVLDNKPNALSDFQKTALHTLARQVMRELDLRFALKTQQVLRKEMDHRVKNSLQSVASLVRVYKSRAERGEDMADAFDAIGRRIEATAALHQMLHDSPLDDAVMCDAFLNQIASLLQDSAPDHVRISCDAAAVAISTLVASSIAVIVSEFVANSIKHAFAGGKAGQVTITGKLREDGTLEIICEDNGGLSPMAASSKSPASGLGKRIMTASAAQIGATLENGPGPHGYRMELAFQA
jgi:two-component sensor histidine kinase